MRLLKANADERGVAHWKRLHPDGPLKSFGIGLTRLRKLAKEVGRDPKLAAKLFDSDVYDAKVLGLLIDDPRQITREQAERQVEDLEGGYLAHVFSSCDATLAKSPVAGEVMADWLDHPDPVRRRCGYGLLYELSKKKAVPGMDEAALLGRVETIRKTIHSEEMWVRESMLAALMGLGKRSAALNRACVKAAKAIGQVDIDYGDTSCEPLDVLKHLTAPRLREKLVVTVTV